MSKGRRLAKAAKTTHDYLTRQGPKYKGAAWGGKRSLHHIQRRKARHV